jgi:large subunit ribosomal protein L15
MMLNEITAIAGPRKRRKRVGRGESSGMGKTCGRGNKGMQSRSGPGPHPLHEGGQVPIFRRAPKRGFNNFDFRREYEVVNLSALEARFEAGAVVDPKALHAAGLTRSADARVKVLGAGELSKKLKVSAHAVAASAKERIEKAGGSITILALRDPAALAKGKRRSAKGKPPAQRPSRLEKKKAGRSA